MNSNSSMDYNILQEYAKDNEIDFLAVYGSFYYGNQNEKSDIDLIIDSKTELNYETLEKHKKRIRKITKRKVDIITPKQMISSLICGYVWRLKEYEIIYGAPTIAE